MKKALTRSSVKLALHSSHAGSSFAYLVSRRPKAGSKGKQAVALRLRAFIGGQSCTNARAQSTAAALKPRKLTQAQREWLLQQELKKTPFIQEEVPPRYDWRTRARSRTVKKGDPAPEFKRRVSYKSEPTQAGRFLKQIQAYKSRFEPLIHAEQEAEDEVVNHRLSTWSLRRLKEEGYCMTDLKGFWLHKSKDDRSVAGFRLSPGVSLPQHIFTYGSQVFVSRLDPLKTEPRRGSVVKVKPEQIDLAFDETFDDLPNDFWRLDLGTPNIAFQRMYDAIKKLAKDPEMIEKDPQNLSDKKMYRLEGTGLRDVLLKSFVEPKGLQRQTHHLQDPGEQHYLSHDQLEHDSRIDQAGGAFSENQLIQSWARRYRRPDPIVVEGDPPLNHLNASQIRAMAMMIGERISLIQGPPGTGKTKTIVEAIKLLKGHFEVPHPILVCTFTNVAIDNLLEGFANGGLKPLRVGNEGSAKPEFQEYMFDEQFDGHPKKTTELDPLIKEYEELDKRIRKLRKDIKTLEDEKPTNWIEKRENMKLDKDRKSYRSYSLKARARLLRESIFYDICTKADVICTTSIRSASYYLQTMDFPVVFLDEASMSTEPASLIPLMKGCKHLALIGDHKQLPPVVVSRDAQQGELDVSLFERLISEGDVPSVMLDVQYRMHPGISKFPSMEFYDTMLLDGTVHAGEVIPSLMPLSSSHLVAHPETGHRPSVIFIDHEGPEATKSRSRVNWTEGYIICSIVEDLLRLNPDLLGEDIGVIAPYKSQMNLLTRLLKKDDEVRDHFKAHLGDRALEVPNVEVKTVDGFEGREKQAIIFSTVRNNQFGHIGFLADRRRLNVGLTRAKRALFVVGSMSTLERGKYGYRSSNVDVPEQEFRTVSKGALAWRNYAQHLVEQNLVYRLRGDDLVKVLLPYASFADRALRYFC